MSMVAVSWCSPDTCGALAGTPALPDFCGGADLAQTLGAWGGNTRYLNALNHEARIVLRAAAGAVHAAGWSLGTPDAPSDVGLITCGYGGWLDAAHRYFEDHVQHGRRNGRGSLFVYTLPTSVGSQVALALRLGGPLLHYQAATCPTQALLHEAQAMVAANEAAGMLALRSDGQVCVCWAVHGSTLAEAWVPCPDAWGELPTDVAQWLAQSDDVGDVRR